MYHAQVKNIQLSTPQVKPNSRSFPALFESFVARPEADWLFTIVLFVLFVPVAPLLVVLPLRLPKAPSPPSTALGVGVLDVLDVLEVWTVFVVVELLLAETDLAVEDELLWAMPPLYGWPVMELRYQFSGGSLMHSPYKAVVKPAAWRVSIMYAAKVWTVLS
jgi:hypothetical protein